jgi:two-component system LytT family response regulator
MKALIIDDEPLLRAELRRMLGAYPALEIVGEAADAESGLECIHRLRPDLLFLDVQMPEKSGLDLLAALETLPLVIFVTAHDRHAMRAFDFGATDYLLKPVTEARLRVAVLRAFAARETGLVPSSDDSYVHAEEGVATAAGTAPVEPLAEDECVLLRDGDHTYFVPVKSIQSIEACGSYARLDLGDRRPLIPRSLNFLEQRLPARLFFRVSRNAIVNIREVTKIEPWFSGGLRATLRNGSTFDLSRRQAKLFRDSMTL